MTPHVHFSPIHALWLTLIVIAVFGTIHLYAISNDNRFSRAWIGLGF